MSISQVCITLLALFGFVLVCPSAHCQTDQPAGAVLAFSDIEVSQALTQIEEHFGVKIHSDGKLEQKVTATLRDPDISQALTSVTSPFGYKWRKVTLAVGPDEEMSGAKLRSVVTALERLDAVGAVVDDPIQNTTLHFRRNSDDSSDLAGQALPTGEVYKTFYFVYSPKPKITFAPSAQTKTGPTAPQGGQVPYGQMSPGGLTEWFSQLDREAQSELVGQLIGSMMQSGEGEVAFWFDSGDEESGTVRQGRVVIRKGESGGGGE